MVLGGRYVKTIPDTSVDGFLQLNYLWQSEAQYTLNQNPLTEQDAYGVVDLSFGVESQTARYPYTVTFFVKNLADEHYVNSLAAVADSSGTEQNVFQFVPKSADRYFGANFRLNF